MSNASILRQSLETKARIRIEKRIITASIRELIAQGLTVKIDNGDRLIVITSVNLSKSIMLTDEETVYAFMPDGKRIGALFFVYGNDGFDVLAGNSISIEPFIPATLALIESLSE